MQSEGVRSEEWGDEEWGMRSEGSGAREWGMQSEGVRSEGVRSEGWKVRGEEVRCGRDEGCRVRGWGGGMQSERYIVRGAEWGGEEVRCGRDKSVLTVSFLCLLIFCSSSKLGIPPVRVRSEGVRSEGVRGWGDEGDETIGHLFTHTHMHTASGLDHPWPTLSSIPNLLSPKDKLSLLVASNDLSSNYTHTLGLLRILAFLLCCLARGSCDIIWPLAREVCDVMWSCSWGREVCCLVGRPGGSLLQHFYNKVCVRWDLQHELCATSKTLSSP